ncbi:MAG TPA: protoporphyrinogen oxidase, partial [Pyrinomonadaceae bacterium]|nr:protoporphyrinogen oxidase [Pyrinomonadaceae bacterium]
MGKRVCIIGGGISGLTTAFLLHQKGLDITLFESSHEVGGNIQSEKKDGFLIEHGPNSLLRSSRIVDLVDSLELGEDVLPATASAKKRFVLIDGKLRALPTGLLSFIFGDFFSLRAKFRLLKEPFVGSSARENESVAEFFERRLGREILEKAADPFISGIFAGDPEQLSISEAFPSLVEYERQYGSLLLGAIRNKSEKADPNFPRSFTFQNGLRTLTGCIHERLSGRVRTGVPVTRIDRLENGFRLITDNGEPEAFD